MEIQNLRNFAETMTIPMAHACRKREGEREKKTTHLKESLISREKVTLTWNIPLSRYSPCHLAAIRLMWPEEQLWTNPLTILRGPQHKWIRRIWASLTTHVRDRHETHETFRSIHCTLSDLKLALSLRAQCIWSKCTQCIQCWSIVIQFKSTYGQVFWARGTWREGECQYKLKI